MRKITPNTEPNIIPKREHYANITRTFLPNILALPNIIFCGTFGETSADLKMRA